MKKGSGTRSGLLWEVERLLNETPELPQILLMENVPAVQGKANKADFQMWLDFLVSKGYTNYVNLLNAKDYGVAQNRLRCFCISLLGEYNYHWPEPIPLDKTIEDYLEDEVGEEYYIKSDKAKRLIEQLLDSGKLTGTRTMVDASILNPRPREIANTITTKDRSIVNTEQTGNCIVEQQRDWRSD